MKDGPIPDPELVGLVTSFIDNRLDSDGSARLEKRLRADPKAREYCADQIEFSSMLHCALLPEPVEITETRRWVVGGSPDAPEWRMEKERGIRFRNQGESQDESWGKRRQTLAWLIGTGLLAGFLGSFVWWRWNGERTSAPVASQVAAAVVPAAPPPKPSIVLRNAGFESMDLSLSPKGMSSSLLDWQDVFPMDLAMLRDINRTSGGKIFAKAGRNVAELSHRGYLTQHLRHSDGSPLLAHSGLKVRIAGWTYLEGAETGNLRCSLDVIVSGRPDTIEYMAKMANIPLKKGGWERFEIFLKLPDNLTKRPNYVNGDSMNAPPLDITGRELFLSIENRNPEGPNNAYLDELEFEVLEP